MARWGTHKIGWKDYPLGHLDDFVLHVPRPDGNGRDYRVLVDIGHHAFSRDLRPDDTEEMIVGPPNDRRCFCLERYPLSLHVPGIIRAGIGDKAYFGEVQPYRPQNYLVIENLAGVEGPYAILFNMTKSRQTPIDAVMFVTSAYAKPKMRRDLPMIRFANLVNLTVQEIAIKRPKK
jgi:hypothetical protein